MRNCVGYGKATQLFHVSTNSFATIKSLSFKTFNKISFKVVHLMSISWIAVSRTNQLIYTIPVSRIKTGIQGLNINIISNRKNYVIITNIRLIINYLIIAIIQLIIMHENLL